MSWAYPTVTKPSVGGTVTKEVLNVPEVEENGVQVKSPLPRAPYQNENKGTASGPLTATHQLPGTHPAHTHAFTPQPKSHLATWDPSELLGGKDKYSSFPALPTPP